MLEQYMSTVLENRERGFKPISFEIGQEITFKALTRDGNKKATRKIVGRSTNGKPLVRYNGWGNFQINWNEILLIDGWEV